MYKSNATSVVYEPKNLLKTWGFDESLQKPRLRVKPYLPTMHTESCNEFPINLISYYLYLTRLVK